MTLSIKAIRVDDNIFLKKKGKKLSSKILKVDLDNRRVLVSTPDYCGQEWIYSGREGKISSLSRT